MDTETVRILSQLIEVQLEQNQVAGRVAFTQAQRAIAAHNCFVHGGPSMETAEADLEHTRGQFERNQERLHKLWKEVMKATVSEVPS